MRSTAMWPLSEIDGSEVAMSTESPTPLITAKRSSSIIGRERSALAHAHAADATAASRLTAVRNTTRTICHRRSEDEAHRLKAPRRTTAAALMERRILDLPKGRVVKLRISRPTTTASSLIGSKDQRRSTFAVILADGAA